MIAYMPFMLGTKAIIVVLWGSRYRLIAHYSNAESGQSFYEVKAS